MKAIVLAGGSGTRLGNLTKCTNKHLLSVGTTPMIYHPVRRSIEAGIKDIMIITGTEYAGSFVNLLENEPEFRDVNFTYRCQKRADGISGALKLCRDFVGQEKCMVILGDNIFFDNLKETVKEFEAQNQFSCKLFLKSVKDPERFGVAVIDYLDDGTLKIKRLIEKPNPSPSNYAVIGVYMYSNDIFDVLDTLTPSKRGELEITEANDILVRAGKADCTIIESEWTDAGTFQSLFEANRMALKRVGIDTE